MASQQLLSLCREPATISSELSKHPDESPGNIAKHLYQSHGAEKLHSYSVDSGVGLDSSQNPLEMARQCGCWPLGVTPSPLFLQAFADALACLRPDPMAGMVSPPLMGSHGTMPLTMVAPVVDIIRHNAHLIRNARKTVFFLTCVWSTSVAQRMIREALIALSDAAEQRGERVAVRIAIDVAGPGHLIESQRYMNSETYTSKKIGLPAPEEIPWLDFEVLSIHTMIFGTMHSKFCVVDGKVATIMSNNVEDNANLEMMTQVEGPIVQSILDSALYICNKASRSQILSLLGEDSSAHATNDAIAQNMANVINETNSRYQSCGDESHLHAVNHQLNMKIDKPIRASGPEIADEEAMVPCFSTMTENPVPMALVSRPPYGACDYTSVNVPQNEAWLSLVRNAKRSIFIQTPDLNAEPLVREISQALKRGVQVTYYYCFGYNDAGEMIPGQGGTNEQVARRLIASLPPDGPELSLLRIHAYVAKDQDHPIHQSFRARACHLKLLIADETVGIQGSGNQDTQSWYHSQELNIMVDSPEICTLWRQGVERNQNTERFGRCLDGIWRDRDGAPGKGYSGDPGTVGGLVRGVVGMVKKVIHQSKGDNKHSGQ